MVPSAEVIAQPPLTLAPKTASLSLWPLSSDWLWSVLEFDAVSLIAILAFSLGAQGAKKGADVPDQLLRLFHGREVAARRHDGPAFEVIILLGPAPGQDEQFAREDRNAGVRFDHRRPRMRRRPRAVTRFVSVGDGRDKTFAHPVNHPGREQVVFGKPPLDISPTVPPVAAPLENPRAQPDRRVVQTVRECLRVAGLHRDVAGGDARSLLGARVPLFL